jgi:hypothetical protein
MAGSALDQTILPFRWRDARIRIIPPSPLCTSATTLS